MVKSGSRRTGKYEKKVDGKTIGRKYEKTKELAIKGETAYFAEAEKVEEQVKALLPGTGPLQIVYYIIFAKEILKAKRKHTGETQRMEICILCRKWWMRGLEAINLNIISNFYAGMACFDIGDKYGLPWTGQTIVYQADDDGSYQKGTTLNRPIIKGVGSHRFTDNGDGTITDNGTGLMWVKDPIAAPGAPFNAVMLWAAAIINCEALNFAGHTDWRLPNIKELLSIVDYETANPSIDAVFFPNTVWPWGYWTSTTVIVFPTAAWDTQFGIGDLAAALKATDPLWVRPVRLGKP